MFRQLSDADPRNRYPYPFARCEGCPFYDPAICLPLYTPAHYSPAADDQRFPPAYDPASPQTKQSPPLLST